MLYDINYNFATFLCNQGFEDRICLGSIISKLNLINNYGLFKKFLPSNIFKDYDTVNWIAINGIKYDINNSLICIKTDINTTFGKVKHIIVSPSKNVYFLYIKLITVCYCRHLSAFEVKETQEWGFISQKNLADCFAYYVHIMSDKKSYVPTNF